MSRAAIIEAPSAQVVRRAIQWSLRLQAQPRDSSLFAQCERWRAQHPEHECAWQRVQTLSGELNAQFRALPASGVAVEVLEQSTQRLNRRQALKLLSGLAVVGSGAWFARDVPAVQHWRADYATGVGQRGSFLLADGSRLQLNTDSAVDQHFTDRRRLIRLTRGEMLVEADTQPAHGPRPALQVQSAHGLFETLAGRFVVRQDDHETRLSVSAGSVLIRLANTGSVEARPGQQYRVSSTQATLVPHPDMDPSAWVEGLIVTRGMRLADFLAEVARYRRGQVACAADIADLRLSGVFRLQDTDRLLAVLTQTLPVQVQYRTRWWVTVRRNV
ncbi:FecR family protein [Pseudomonas sp. RP23018S]|uniref:FecR family protein n=1 Tax=Pseudomonas sp. RP23018S TaxID=3096037 RepID=UPI002ACAC046|nr:FecR family protein [Pseudomonas sp. RP23018S]MDZ5604961.1 FecR family protein [Pseudomonas sp. RP23018S]